MKHMSPSKEDKITVKIESYLPNKSLQLTLNWDADIDDWVEAFKTILIHQTFCEDTVKELFEPWHECMEDKREIDSQSTSAAFNTPPKWWKDQIIGKDSCGPVGKEVW
jgi:hypothetical protein